MSKTIGMDVDKANRIAAVRDETAAALRRGPSYPLPKGGGAFVKTNPQPRKKPKAAPKPKRKPGDPTVLIFRLQSSRGTDIIEWILLPPDTTQEKAREYSNEWADLHIRGSAIDSCTVSYKRVRAADRPTLLKRWGNVCKRYTAAKYARDEVQAMLAAHDWTRR